jgi:hypothetical protein
MNKDKTPAAVRWNDYAEWLKPRWTALLASNPTEKLVQAFLEAHPCLLPGATDDLNSLSGHHGACWDAVFRQPELKGLGRTRFPDFMWVRRDTGAVRPILIEIEAPSKRWFSASRRLPTSQLAQAQDQLLEWRIWFEKPENVLIFRQNYVPAQFHSRPVEPQFVLILGRDQEFRPPEPTASAEVARRKRDLLPRANEHYFTYDRLAPEEEARDYVTVTATKDKFRVDNVPPTLKTGHRTSALARRSPNLTTALVGVELMTQERKNYVASRWEFWASKESDAALHQPHPPGNHE